MSTANTDFTWKLNAIVQEEMAVGNTTFNDVVTEVHWELVGSRPLANAYPFTSRIYGSVILSPPIEGANNFINIEELEKLDANTKLDRIAEWAEIVEPGFVENKKKALDNIIDNKLNEPVVKKKVIL